MPLVQLDERLPGYGWLIRIVISGLILSAIAAPMIYIFGSLCVAPNRNQRVMDSVDSKMNLNLPENSEHDTLPRDKS